MSAAQRAPLERTTSQPPMNFLFLLAYLNVKPHLTQGVWVQLPPFEPAARGREVSGLARCFRGLKWLKSHYHLSHKHHITEVQTQNPDQFSYAGNGSTYFALISIKHLTAHSSVCVPSHTFRAKIPPANPTILTVFRHHQVAFPYFFPQRMFTLYVLYIIYIYNVLQLKTIL